MSEKRLYVLGHEVGLEPFTVQIFYQFEILKDGTYHVRAMVNDTKHAGAFEWTEEEAVAEVARLRPLITGISEVGRARLKAFDHRVWQDAKTLFKKDWAAFRTYALGEGVKVVTSRR